MVFTCTTQNAFTLRHIHPYTHSYTEPNFSDKKVTFTHIHTLMEQPSAGIWGSISYQGHFDMQTGGAFRLKGNPLYLLSHSIWVIYITDHSNQRIPDPWNGSKAICFYKRAKAYRHYVHRFTFTRGRPLAEIIPVTSTSNKRPGEKTLCVCFVISYVTPYSSVFFLFFRKYFCTLTQADIFMTCFSKVTVYVTTSRLKLKFKWIFIWI